MILMTSLCTPASHQILYPIKSSRESEAPPPYIINRCWGFGLNKYCSHIHCFLHGDWHIVHYIGVKERFRECKYDFHWGWAIFKKGGSCRYAPPCLPVSVEITSTHWVMLCISMHFSGTLNVSITLLQINISNLNIPEEIQGLFYPEIYLANQVSHV